MQQRQKVTAENLKGKLQRLDSFSQGFGFIGLGENGVKFLVVQQCFNNNGKDFWSQSCVSLLLSQNRTLLLLHIGIVK